MNVLFLNPPFFNHFSRESRSPAVTKSSTIYYPKWLSQAAGVAIKAGHNVDLIDAPAWSVDVKYVKDRIAAKNIEALVVDCSTPSIINDLQVVDQIVDKFTKLPVLMVGRHVSVLPEESLKASRHLKYVALKEYDYIVRDWLEALSSGASMSTVKGLVWKNASGEIERNQPAELILNLDELPFVSEVYKRFLKIEDYYYGFAPHPNITFDTSRGCPYHCTFCAFPQTFSGHRMRYRSASNVADEFDFIKKEFPKVRSITFEDDTYIISKDHVMGIADELIRRGNKIPYNVNQRADLIADLDFFKTLKKSGLRLVIVGFESGDDEVLKHMKKNLNLAKAEEFMELCRKSGILVHGCFMVGNLNETRETMQKTLDLAMKLQPDTAQFFPLMVYPGTEAYQEAKDKGYLITEDWNQWLTDTGLHNAVINLPNLSNEDLVEFCDYARRKYYTHPKYLVRKMGQSLTDFDELKRNWIGFKSLVKYLIKGSYSK